MTMRVFGGYAIKEPKDVYLKRHAEKSECAGPQFVYKIQLDFCSLDENSKNRPELLQSMI